MQTAYGKTKEQYLEAIDGTPIRRPVMKNHDWKYLQTGLDWIKPIRYLPRGVVKSAKIAFGTMTNGIAPAWNTLGDNPFYQFFGMLFCYQHSINTARYGWTTDLKSYPNIQNFWRFEAVRPVRVYFVTPPNNTVIPANYSSWLEAPDLFMSDGRKSEVRYKDFGVGLVNLPCFNSAYRTNVTGILGSFMIAELFNGNPIPYTPPHPDLQPGLPRPLEVLEIFRATNPHVFVPGWGCDNWTHPETFTWHPLVDGYGMPWGHLHTLGPPFFDTYYELRPEWLERIPDDKKKFYAINRTHHELGKIKHTGFWDFKYEVYRADNKAPLKFQQTIEIGSLPDPEDLLRTEREWALALGKADGTPLVLMSFKRPVALKRVIANAKAMPLPSGVSNGVHYPLYHPELLPTNFMESSALGVDMTVMTGDGGYNNIKTLPPPDMGIEGFVNVNVAGRVRTLRPSSGKWTTVKHPTTNANVTVWQLHDDPAQWFDTDITRDGTERWSNLNPQGSTPDLSWRFSYKSLLLRMIEDGYKNVENITQADAQMEADGFWFLTSYDGLHLREKPDYDVRRQYFHRDAEFAFDAQVNGTTTSNARYLVPELRDNGDDDTYRPTFASDNKEGIIRNREEFVIPPGV